MASETNTADTARRHELAAFLRSRRGADHAGGRRAASRVPAADAGVAARGVAQAGRGGRDLYTWLEQGASDPGHASVLEAVARTLRLEPVERQHLSRLAECRVRRQPEGGGQLLRPEIQAILDGLSPMPASVVTERYDILAWNAAQ